MTLDTGPAAPGEQRSADPRGRGGRVRGGRARGGGGQHGGLPAPAAARRPQPVPNPKHVPGIIGMEACLRLPQLGHRDRCSVTGITSFAACCPARCLHDIQGIQGNRLMIKQLDCIKIAAALCGEHAGRDAQQSADSQGSGSLKQAAQPSQSLKSRTSAGILTGSAHSPAGCLRLRRSTRTPAAATRS